MLTNLKFLNIFFLKFPTNELKLNNGNLSEMTLTELQEIAIRQQQQIEINQQLLLAKEKRLKLLKLEDQKNQQLSILTSHSFSLNGLSSYNQQQQQQQNQKNLFMTNNQSKTLENASKLENLKQSVLGQELKIFKLKELRNQIIKHKLSNSNMNSELELIKSLFSKKERELCDAIKNVSELTKQIEQLKKIKSLSFGTQSSMTQANLLSKNNNLSLCELEKLKQELQIRNKLNEQQAKKIMQQHELFNQKQIEVISLDRRIEELQNRIATKRNLNQQISLTCNKFKSNSLASPNQQEENIQQQQMKLNIADLDPINTNDNQEDFEHENQEYLNELESQEMLIQNTANLQKNIFQNNDLNSLPNSSMSPSKATAKFASKQEIANTYMNKYGSEAFQRYQQNSIKIMKQQINNSDSRQNGETITNLAQPTETKSETQGYQSEIVPDTPSFTALPSHLKFEFDKIKYLPDMVKTIKKRHSISEIEGSSSNNTIPPLIFQKMLEKHHKTFTDQKQQQNQQKKLNQIQESPTETPATVSNSNQISSSTTENFSINKINESTVIQTNTVNKQNVFNDLKTDSTDSTEQKDVNYHVLRTAKPIIKQTNSEINANNWNNTKSNGTLFLNNKNNRRVNFDPHALLLDAAVEGELDLVMKCAKLVDDISEPNDEGITALHNSVCAGHFEIVKFLVEFGCDINFADNDGWTPVRIYSFNSKIKIFFSN